MQRDQKCKWCLNDTTKSALALGHGVCMRCWKSVSVEQEPELWTMYSSSEPQWCHAKHPRTGRPCWKETKKDQTECDKTDCINHTV